MASWNEEPVGDSWNDGETTNDNPRHDQGCRVCGSNSHFARDCPDGTGQGGPGGCFNCGEVGHNKADCPNPAVEREFTGECRTCGQAGHRARECPQAGPLVCRNCKEEGHVVADCSANRMNVYLRNLKIDAVPDKDAYDAVISVGKAKDSDIDDIKKAIFAYAMSAPMVTWSEIEECCREHDLKVFLIAKEQEISDTHTIVNLQGQVDQKYVVTFQTSAQPRRKKLASGWPQDAEENKQRLSAAGLPMDRMVPKCGNCNQLGHIRSACPEDKVEVEVVDIKCVNCDQEGHRARDCTEPRKSNGCKNCGQEGHMSKECPEPPNLDNVECKSCGEMGHFSRDCPSREPEICRNCLEEGHRAKDCTNERVMKCRNCDGVGHMASECDQPKDMSRVQCRNCDEMSHVSRECPKPTDWSRVECQRCHEKGHTVKRCTKSEDEIADGADAGAGGWSGQEPSMTPSAFGELMGAPITTGSSDW